MPALPDTIETPAVPAPRELPDRALLWRACVRWYRERGNEPAVKALLAIDPWRP